MAPAAKRARARPRGQQTRMLVVQEAKKGAEMGCKRVEEANGMGPAAVESGV